MDLVALFAITIIGVTCFLLLLGGFWIAPWLIVVILVGLLLVLLRIPLFSQDEPFSTEDEELGAGELRSSAPSVTFLKEAHLGADVALTAASSTTEATSSVPDELHNDRLQLGSVEKKALSYRGARYKHDTEAVTVATANFNLIECEGRYRGNRSKLFAVKEKLD